MQRITAKYRQVEATNHMRRVSASIALLLADYTVNVIIFTNLQISLNESNWWK